MNWSPIIASIVLGLSAGWYFTTRVPLMKRWNIKRVQRKWFRHIRRKHPDWETREWTTDTAKYPGCWRCDSLDYTYRKFL